MQITITLNDGRVLHPAPPPDGEGWIETGLECPAGPGEVGPHYLDVRGVTTSKDDRHMAGAAVCMACQSEVGKIRVNFDTIFGIHEDRAVMARCRVY